MRKTVSFLWIVLFLTLVAGLATAADLRPQDQVPMISAPSLDLDALRAEDAQREIDGLPYRYAVATPVQVRPATDGIWERLDADTLVWRLRLESPGAVSLNLGFGTYFMPEGGALRIFAADGSEAIRPFTAEDNASHGQLWTPVVRDDRIVVELTIPEAAVNDLKLELTSFNIGYRGFERDGTINSGACNIDVVCPEGDAWRDEIPSVAVISRGGGLNCTGFMVNNTANDQTPYFMTANHCGYSSSSAAASLVAYWNYETSVCGGTPDGTLDQFNSGAFYRASYSPSDFTLMELDSPPDPSFGVTFAGWDATGADATSAVAIHHPSVDEKRISFENQATSTTSYLGTSVPGDGTHVRITDWDKGTTEGGSSGSPLFSQNHQVIGQLHGGYAACGNNSSDWYGKFSVSWNGGGTPSTSLKPWLDPGNTGQLKVNTLVPGANCQSDPDCDDGLFCNGAETCAANGTCTPGADPCPGEDCDETADVCVPLVCNTDGTCDAGEDCHNCPNDCIGKQNGNPNRQYCCGDGVCEKAEDSNNCAVDCGPPAACGDGVCDLSEDACGCPADCGAPPAGEISCTNGVDDDCDGLTDCADGDCAGDPACSSSCLPQGDACTSNRDCCSNRCKGRGGSKTCQ